MFTFNLTKDVILCEHAKQDLLNVRAGALVTFEGWVRNHNQGKEVEALEYEVYEELASSEGQLIIDEAKRKFNVLGVQCIHRYGFLGLGECAVWVGATAAHRDDAFRAARYVIDQVKHRLPIWKKEHYIEDPAQWVFCRDHHTHVHFHADDYYQRQRALLDQSKLAASKVIVIGVGGLGCPVLQSLTSAGVGVISVVDFDKIDISNLHRQPLYTLSHVGEKKAVVAAKYAGERNPFIQVTALDLRLDAHNVEATVKGFDLVIDCTDNFRTKILLNDACFKLKTPLISASIYKHEGSLRTYAPDSQFGCMRCFRTAAPDDALIGNCNDFGVVGASVAILGNMQASEAIAYLQHGTNISVQHTVLLNVADLSTHKLQNHPEDGCVSCQGLLPIVPDDMEIRASDLQNDELVIDMRGKEDLYLEQFRDSEKKIVVMCHRGNRSLRLVKHYRASGCSHFYSLAGGACSL